MESVSLIWILGKQKSVQRTSMLFRHRY